MEEIAFENGRISNFVCDWLLTVCMCVCLYVCLYVCVSVCQCVQLIVCDWLLTCRSEIWLTRHQSQSDSQSHGGPESSMSTSDLTGYQRDLTSLRHLAHTLRAAVPRVSATSSLLTAS